MDAPNPERERVFDLFRHWGYLEADLDPLGMLRPQTQADLQMEGDYAREARRFYCGTMGTEFMHITEPDRRRWIQERMEAEPAPSISNGCSIYSSAPTSLSRYYSSATSAPNASRSRATPPSCLW